MSGESTAYTDFRKPAKVKRPKGSAKKKVRPKPRKGLDDADGEDEEMGSSGTIAVASARFQKEINEF